MPHRCSCINHLLISQCNWFETFIATLAKRMAPDTHGRKYRWPCPNSKMWSCDNSSRCTLCRWAVRDAEIGCETVLFCLKKHAAKHSWWSWRFARFFQHSFHADCMKSKVPFEGRQTEAGLPRGDWINFHGNIIGFIYAFLSWMNWDLSRKILDFWAKYRLHLCVK